MITTEDTVKSKVRVMPFSVPSVVKNFNFSLEM